MKASEARELAEKGDKVRLNRILDVIKKAARAGKFSTFWYEDVSMQERAYLTDYGYTVSNTAWDAREQGYLTQISW